MYSGPYFNAQRIAMLPDYYTPEEISKLPPGSRKHLERTGQLPPGIEKKLIREGQLPRDYWTQLVPHLNFWRFAWGRFLLALVSTCITATQ